MRADLKAASQQAASDLANRQFASAASSLWEMIRIQLELQQQQLNGTGNCDSSIRIIIVYEYFMIPAAAMLLLACIATRRKRFLPHLLNGRPGLAHAMNILEDRSVRFSYALAFGIAAQLCHNLLLGDSELYKVYISSQPGGQFKFLHVLYRISEVCIYSVIMLPIFLTITARNLVFYTLGSLYMCTMTVTTVLWLLLIDCPQLSRVSHFIVILKFLPSLLCMAGLCVIFPYRLMQLAMGHNKSVRVTQNEYIYQYEYVSELLRNNKLVSQAEIPGVYGRACQLLRKILYRKQNGFRYSPRIICTYTAVIIVIYMVTYSIVKEVAYWMKLTNDILNLLESIANAIGLPETAVKEIESAKIYIGVVTGCFVISTCMILLLNLVNLGLMLISYRSNILQMYKGNYTGFPTRKERTTNPTFLIVTNIRYGGYQIAFTGIGIFLQYLVAMALTLLPSVVLFDPVNGAIRPWFLEFLEYYWPLAIISGNVLLVQYLLVRFVFNKQESENGKISIDNRNLYFNWAYFMFYFNVFWGLLTGTLRLLKSMAFTVCFFNRLDWSHYPKKFEILDEGFLSYTGLLYMENAHTNPILRSFLSLVSEQVAQSRQSRVSSNFVSDSVPTDKNSLRLNSIVSDTLETQISHRSRDNIRSIRKCRALTRWHLAVSLSKNPGLRLLRSHYMTEARAALRRRSQQATLQKEMTTNL